MYSSSDPLIAVFNDIRYQFSQKNKATFKRCQLFYEKADTAAAKAYSGFLLGKALAWRKDYQAAFTYLQKAYQLSDSSRYYHIFSLKNVHYISAQIATGFFAAEIAYYLVQVASRLNDEKAFEKASLQFIDCHHQICRFYPQYFDSAFLTKSLAFLDKTLMKKIYPLKLVNAERQTISLQSLYAHLGVHFIREQDVESAMKYFALTGRIDLTFLVSYKKIISCIIKPQKPQPWPVLDLTGLNEKQQWVIVLEYGIACCLHDNRQLIDDFMLLEKLAVPNNFAEKESKSLLVQYYYFLVLFYYYSNKEKLVKQYVDKLLYGFKEYIDGKLLLTLKSMSVYTNQIKQVSDTKQGFDEKVQQQTRQFLFRADTVQARLSAFFTF